MSPTNDARRTQKLTGSLSQRVQAKSPFAGGKAELLADPTFSLFREIVMRNPQKAAETMRQAPECVGFAARMLSDPDPNVSIEAGAALLCAVEIDVLVESAAIDLKRALLYSDSDQTRLFAAKVFSRLAVKGHDISDAHIVLSSAQKEDGYEPVRLIAENALIAAGHPPESL